MQDPIAGAPISRYQNEPARADGAPCCRHPSWDAGAPRQTQRASASVWGQGAATAHASHVLHVRASNEGVLWF